MKDNIFIYDVTLRDGEQASGFHMYPEEKIAIARQLASMGVDGIEAGFAISSPGDANAISMIAREVGTKDGPVISSLARAVDADIEAAAKAIKPAYNKRIHTFIATSDEHIIGKFRKDRNWVIETAVNAIKKAKSYVDDVEFSCEDFGRTDKDYTVTVVCEAIKAGATTINLPDTVGWMMPHESYEKVKYVIDEVRKQGYDAIFSVHNHNDFGMATATTIEAIRAGARQAELTINGIGERAGNTSLEEVVAIMRKRGIADCNVDTKQIGEASRMVSMFTGVYPQPNKAIVGRNAFAHEAGIHQDGQIKDRNTYETMDPAEYGVESITTFGPRSGRNALRAKYKSLGIELGEEDFQKAAKAFTTLADKVKRIDDADIVRSVKTGEEIPEYYSLASYASVNSGVGDGASVRIRVGHEVKAEYITDGNGHIDAGVRAINKIIDRNYKMKDDFKVVSEGQGSDAMAFTQLTITKNGWEVTGRNEDTDVVRSAMNAYIDACNRMRYMEEHFKR